MISTQAIKRLFAQGNAALSSSGFRDGPLEIQFYRGRQPHTWPGQHAGGCERHMAVFERYNAIPEYCFSCYKIVIAPRTVVELLKLMVIFEQTKFATDNTRKCLVECREDVKGTYKGLIYSRNLEEAESISIQIENMLAQEISPGIPIELKRGCSEFALSYPGYAVVDPQHPPLQYDPGWRLCETGFDQDTATEQQLPLNDTYTQAPGYTLQDARVMLAWLKYAATIGDESYLEIAGVKLPPFENIHRPQPFQPPA